MDSFSITIIVIGAVVSVYYITRCITKAVRSTYTDAEAIMEEARAKASEAAWKAEEARQLARREKWTFKREALARMSDDEPEGDSTASVEITDDKAAVAAL